MKKLSQVRTGRVYGLLLLFFFLLAISFAKPARPLREPGSSHSFCGSYRGRILDQLRRDTEIRTILRQKRQRDAAFLNALPANGSRDHNQIALIEDDGTIVSPVNYFDLSGYQIKLAPAGPESFQFSRQPILFDRNNLGSRLTLTDDSSFQVLFQEGFSFPFLGSSYSGVFINSDGNLTFTAGDSASNDRDLTRFNAGPPRLAPFFADLNPETSPNGGIYWNQLPDRILITWDHIRKFSETGSTADVSVQVVLFANGTFQFAYDSSTVESGIIGWSGGDNRQMVQLVDFSQTSNLIFSGPQAEKFSQSTEVSNTALARKFYESHPDSFDQLVVFTNFPYDLGNAFAYELNVRNDLQGIGLWEERTGQPPTQLFDYSEFFGSRRLESYLSMNQLSAFPEDPEQIFFGTNSTLAILGQEAGHRWLAYVSFLKDGLRSQEFLGRDQDHWSFFFNSEGSVMEGNRIQDNGDGSYLTTESTTRFSRLDQYLMGFRPPEEVGPLFYVENVTGTRRTPSSAPATGVSFRGSRRNLTVQDIIAAEGARIPSSAEAPKVFRQAFILLVQRGSFPSNPELEKIVRIRTGWEQFFHQATDGLGSVDSRLGPEFPTPEIFSVAPISGSTLGGTRVYISGANFRPGATVAFGNVPAQQSRWIDSNLITAIAPPQAASAVSITVTHEDRQSARLVDAFAYKTLAAAVFPDNVLRIPYAVDSLTYRSNLGINNPTAAAARITVSLLDSNGLVVSQLRNLTIPPYGYLQQNSFLRDMEGTGAVSGREGTVVLEADQQIEAFVSQINNHSGDPAILDGIRRGHTKLLLQSAANTGPYRSSLLIANLAAETARLTLRALRRNDGVPVGTPLDSLEIAGNGFIFFDNLLEALGVSDEYGPVEITCANGKPLAAASLVTNLLNNSGSYFQAIPKEIGNRVEYIPLVGDVPAICRTNLGLNNLSAQKANLRLELVNPAGVVEYATLQAISLAPGEYLQINKVVATLLALNNVAPNSANFPCYLKISSDQPIRTYASFINEKSNDPAIEEGISQAATHLLLKSAANTNYQSNLILVNPNPVPISVQLAARNGDIPGNGAISGSRSFPIPAHGFMRIENILEFLESTSRFGPVEIRSLSDLPVIGVSLVSDPLNQTSGFFSLIPLPDQPPQ